MRARVAASIGMAALLAIALAGCNFFVPQGTLEPYDPADGLSITVGDVEVSNALIVSEDGQNGNLIFSAVNATPDVHDLLVQYESNGKKVTLQLEVEADSISEFGYGEGGQLFLADINSAPGTLFPIYFQYGDEQGGQLLVPVLGGSLDRYATLLPTPPPTPTPTPTEGAATPTATPTQ